MGVVVQAARQEIDSLQQEAQQSHMVAKQAKGALAQLQVLVIRHSQST